MAKRKCRYGKLKNPKGRRICRQKPRGKKRRAGKRKGSKRGKRQCKSISINCQKTMSGRAEICKVHVSGEPVKAMTKAKTASYVGTIVRALRKRGCHPRVKRIAA